MGIDSRGYILGKVFFDMDYSRLSRIVDGRSVDWSSLRGMFDRVLREHQWRDGLSVGDVSWTVRMLPSSRIGGGHDWVLELHVPQNEGGDRWVDYYGWVLRWLGDGKYGLEVDTMTGTRSIRRAYGYGHPGDDRVFVFREGDVMSKLPDRIERDLYLL